MKRLEGLLQRLMGREAGPFVAPQLRIDPGLLQISLHLMQPAGGAIHDRHCGGIRAEALHYRSRRKPRSLTWECNRGISMQKGGQGHLHHTFARNARSLSWSPPTLASCSLKIMQHCRRITIEGIDLIISVRRRIHMIPAQMVPIIHKTSLTRDRVTPWPPTRAWASSSEIREMRSRSIMVKRQNKKGPEMLERGMTHRAYA